MTAMSIVFTDALSQEEIEEYKQEGKLVISGEHLFTSSKSNGYRVPCIEINETVPERDDSMVRFTIDINITAIFKNAGYNYEKTMVKTPQGALGDAHGRVRLEISEDDPELSHWFKPLKEWRNTVRRSLDRSGRITYSDNSYPMTFNFSEVILEVKLFKEKQKSPRGEYYPLEIVEAGGAAPVPMKLGGYTTTSAKSKKAQELNAKFKGASAPAPEAEKETQEAQEANEFI